MKMEKYEDAVSYIMSIPRFSGKNENLHTESFLNFLNCFDSKAKYIHVAGTNGKGSVCAFMTSICMEMGMKTATFTSPHLVDIRERIAVDGKMIAKEEFLSCFVLVRDALEDYRKQGNEDYSPSFFSYLFFIGMEAFHRAGAEVVILETGLGGRLDATNSIPAKAVSIITEIGMDHMEVLGDTIEKIAAEKAGIIKAGVPLVFADRKGPASRVITETAERLGADYYPIIAPNSDKILPINKRIAFSYESRYYNNVTLKIESPAVYQVENAMLALAGLERVFEKDRISLKDMEEGLLKMKWPGRMEEVEPGVFFDGAHNVDGVKMFLESVKRDECKGKRRLLFSAVTDKQAHEMLGLIEESGLFDELATGCMETGRSKSREELEDLVKDNRNASVFDSVTEAYRMLRASKRADDYLYVCGSLYMIGELKGGNGYND